MSFESAKVNKRNGQISIENGCKDLDANGQILCKGGDSRAKEMLNALALTLCVSLELNHSNIIDNAVHNHQIAVTMEDDNEETSAIAIPTFNSNGLKMF